MNLEEITGPSTLEEMQRLRDEQRAAADKEFASLIPGVMEMEREKARLIAQAKTQSQNERALERELAKGRGKRRGPGARKQARKVKR